MTVAALYVQQGGVYSSLPGVVAYDVKADARNYAGPWPVVAHPPCRAWGKFRHVAKPRDGERELAFHALEMVRRYGGVLEHPVGSQFFAAAGISRSDLVRVNQVDWGHRAIKSTYLLLVGCTMPDALPQPGVPVTTVERLCRQERERTPRAFAEFLVGLARSARL